MEKLFLVLIVGLGGFIGASLRYIISLNAVNLFGGNFPYGTFIVNVVGAFLIGFIMELSLDLTIISTNAKLFLTTGIMGGLTTFSTFSFETLGMISSGNIIMALVNISLNLFLGIIAVALGQLIARFIF